MSAIDFKKLNARIARDPETFLRAMGYHGEVVNGEFITGDIHGNPGKSFGINLQKALFNDLNDAEGRTSGKGWINLIAKKLTKDRKAAAEHIVEGTGWNVDDFQPDERPPKRKSGDPIMPVPSDVPKIPYRVGDPLKPGSDTMLTSTYAYRNAEGELLHYVLRFEGPATEGGKPSKEIRPLHYFGSSLGWKMKGPQATTQSTLIGLENLKSRRDDNVLIVEGEKTALAAREVFPGLICITWQGGVGRLSKANFLPLQDRVVTYWPDADEAGRASIEPLENALAEASVASLSVVQPFGLIPEKWDLADEVPPDIDIHHMLAEAELIDLSAPKQITRYAYGELNEHWYYIADTEEFFHIETGIRFSKRAFDNLYRHLPEAKSGQIGSQFLEDFAENKLLTRSYYPGVSDYVVISPDGVKALNTWRPADVIPSSGDASPLMGHMYYLCGDDASTEFLLDTLAFMLQRPGEKLKYMTVIAGKQGTGKSFVGELMRVLVGMHNSVMIETNELSSDFNGYMDGNVLVVIEEIITTGRLDIMNSLKPKITQPTIQINRKYENLREIRNTTNFIAFSNHWDALLILPGDRRYFIAGTDEEKKAASYYADLWAWTEANYGTVLQFLLDRDLSQFSPNAKPPSTSARNRMINEGRPALVVEIERMIADHQWPFHRDLIVVDDVVGALKGKVGGVTLPAVRKALKALGAEDLRQKKFKDGSVVKSVSPWAVRDIQKWQDMPNAAVARAYFQDVSVDNEDDADASGLFGS